MLPQLAAVLSALVVAAAWTLTGARRAARRAENFCRSCGRRMILGHPTCDCDHEQ